MKRAYNRPSIPVMALLVAGLAPAGEAWFSAVAVPALSIQIRYAVPLFVSGGGAATRENRSGAGVSATRLQRAAAAMTLLLEARK